MSGVGEIGWVWGLDKILLTSGNSTFSGFMVRAGIRAGGFFASTPPHRTRKNGAQAFVRNLDFTSDGWAARRIDAMAGVSIESLEGA